MRFKSSAATNGRTKAIETRLLSLLVEQTVSAVTPIGMVIILALLVAPVLENSRWIIAVIVSRAGILALSQLAAVRLRIALERGTAVAIQVRTLAIIDGVGAFLWGVLTWPLAVGISMGFMTFLVVTICLFAICLTIVSAGLHRKVLLTTAVGGGLGLAPKIALLTPTIGPFLPIGFAIFLSTTVAHALLVSQQARAGALIQLRSQRISARLSGANAALQRALDRATWLADRDVLTELRNRRAFKDDLNQLVRQFPHRQACLILIDIDHFKRINDRFGHEMGDGALVAVGTTLRQWEEEATGRIAGRWGGEEFIVLACLQHGEQTQQVAENLRRRIECLGEQLHWPGPFELTASFGSTRIDGLKDFTSALVRADLALYDAKEAGRNCCRLAA